MKISTKTHGRCLNTKSTGFTWLSFSFLLLMLLGTAKVNAQIAAWQLNGALGSESSINASTINGNLNNSTLIRNGGVNTSALANTFSGTNFTASGTRTDAVNNNRGFSFTISAKPNFKVSLSTLDVRFRRSGTGPNAFAWFWSTDGTNFTQIGSDISYTSTNTNGDAQAQLNLSGITQLQNVASGTTITIRLNGWGATATGGTFAIGRSLTNGATDYSLQIGGTVDALGTAPTVTTTAVSAIATTSASSGGNVTSDGGLSTTRGVDFGTSPAPTGNATSDGTGVGSYTSSLSSLTVNTQYYYRAYATNSIATSYGIESSFYTLANTPGAPTVNNATINSLNVTVNANSNPASTEFAIQETGSTNYVQSDGSLGATEVWQTASTWGTKTVTGLASGTSYTFQVKARNGDNVPTAFGSTAGGTTLTPNSPDLSTTTINPFGAVCLNITEGPQTFTITGTDLTNADVTVGPLSGYSFSKDDLSYSSSLTYVQGGGTFSENVFVKFTPTSVQSYNGDIPVAGGGASNADVTASGSGINTKATVTTGGSSNITQVSATLNGTITANGCSSVSAYGIEYSTTNNFVEGTGTQVAGGSLNVNAYSSSLTGLSANTTYYYKAYATNNGGMAYGAQSSFATLGLAAPVATAATANTSTGFTANWNAVTGADDYRLDVSTTSDFVDVTASTFVSWTFPTNATTVTPDITNANNAAKTVTTTGGTITDAAGLTTRAPSANAWQSGDATKYWQIDIDATGFYGLNISSRQLSSNTGPRDFKLQYRIGAGSFIDVTGGAITVLNDSWVSGTVTNLSLPAACDNQPVLSIRWIMTSNTSVAAGTVASGGTSRIDNIVVKGKAPFFVSGYGNLTVNGLSQPVTGLTSGTTYYYRVRAHSTNSTSANSNSITTSTCSVITASAGANGNISPNGATDVCNGGSQSYTITPDACYSVADVLVDGVSQGAITTYNFTNVSANHTISATFALAAYAITVTPGSNGSITPGTGNVNCGNNATYTITPDACYSVGDVIVDGVSQGAMGSYTFTNVTAPHTISASFVPTTFAITVTAGANGTITPGTGNVNCGDNATYTITPDGGYAVDDVIVDGVSQGAITTYTFNNVQSTHTISASFVTAATFTINASAGPNGNVSPIGATVVNSGGSQAYTISADPCYSIADVLVDGVSQGAITTYTFSNVIANHTISATFVQNTFAITVTAGPNGSVTPATGNVSCGSNATYTITPNSCYAIVDVVVDGVSQGAIPSYTFNNVQATHTISATFSLNTYMITVSAGANGTITPGSGSVNCGDNASYTITPDVHYSIADVIVDGVSQGATGSYTFNNVQVNHTISASFSLNPPVLSASPLAAFGAVCLNETAGPNTFTITGTDLSNAPVTLAALNGYSYSTDNIGYASSLSIPVPMSGNLSQLVYVKFTPSLVQSYNGNIVVGGGGASDVNVMASGSGINTAPSVTTGGSSNITQVSATLNGTITANGCSAVSAYGIEYSTSNGFANGTGTPVAGGVLNVNTYSSAVTGLSANTTYYYKAYATNNGGTSYGSQQSFTTTALDAPVATAATGITSTSFVANWNAVTGADDYRLDVSTDPNFVSNTATTLAGWSFPISGTTVTPDVANANNTTKTLTTTASGGITSTAGATTQAATCNTSPAWQSGSGTKYWQVDVNTTGFYNIKVSSKQRSSATGPRDFKLQYRVGAGAFIDVTGGTVTTADNFTTGVLANVALPAQCDNQTSISLRWIMTSNTSVNAGTVAAAGSSRIDDILVSGNAPLFVAGYENLTVNGLSQPVTGLANSTTYYYRVRAHSTNSTSANSNTVSTTTCSVITASAGANGSISPTGATDVCNGGNQAYTISADACHSVADVLVDGVSQGAITNYTFNNVTVNHTISASFVLNTYAITVAAGANGSISPVTGNVNCGDNASYTISPDACYNIADVVVDGVSQGPITTYTFTNVQAPHTISASFAPNTYTITVTAGPNGTITPGTGSVTCGSNATYTITPASCYHIVDVIVDGVSQGVISSYTFTNVQAAHSISATFAINAPFPTPGPLSGPVNVCPYIGTPTQLTFSVPAIIGATSYAWIIPPTCTLVSQNMNSITITVGAGFIANANKQVRVTALSSCGNSPQAIFYLLAQLPGTPQPIVASTSNVCPSIATNVPITYTIPKVPAASEYIWNNPAGTSIVHTNGLGENDTTVILTFNNSFATGNLTVQSKNDCGTSTARSITITRNNPSTPGLISGPTNACPYISPNGTPASYTVAAVANATTYNWTFSFTPVGLTGQGSNSIGFTYPNGFTSGTVSVTASNGCGTSGIRNLSITTLNPATPSVIDVIQLQACPNRQFSYTLATMPANASSVQWTWPAAATYVSGQGTTSLILSYPATTVNGNVTAQAVNNCGVSTTRLATVKLPACAPERNAGGSYLYTKGAAATETLDVNVFPNPTTTDFKVQVITAGKDAINVRVLDIQGRQVNNFTVQPYEATNFGQSLKAGSYLLEITNGKTKTTKRIMKF